MNIQNKIQNWNEVLLQADKKVKEVVDQATGQFYFEVAEYKNENSMACKVINMIKEKTGKDWRFSFLNIDKVIFTTKHESNLEEFMDNYRFDINTENFAYSNVTVKEFDVIKRSNALDKVMARELPIQISGLVGSSSRGFTDFNKMLKDELIMKNPPVVLNTPKSEYKVELDDFQKELVAEYSKPEHKATVKVAKAKSLGRGR